jgi:hypothetical protein
MDIRKILENIVGFGAVAFILIVLIIIMVSFNNGFQSASSDSNAKAVEDRYTVAIARYFDYIMPCILLISLLVIYINPANVFDNVINMILFLLAILIIPFAAMVVSNIYSDSNINGAFNVVSGALPITNFIMNNYGIVAIFYVAIAFIILQVKNANQ